MHCKGHVHLGQQQQQPNWCPCRARSMRAGSWLPHTPAGDSAIPEFPGSLLECPQHKRCCWCHRSSPPSQVMPQGFFAHRSTHSPPPPQLQVGAPNHTSCCNSTQLCSQAKQLLLQQRTEPTSAHCSNSVLTAGLAHVHPNSLVRPGPLQCLLSGTPVVSQQLW